MSGDPERTFDGLDEIVVPRPRVRIGKALAFGTVLVVMIGAVGMVLFGQLGNQIKAVVVLYLTVAIVGGFFEKDLKDGCK